MGSDTIAVAVDRRDGPAFIEDRPYGRPIQSSPWPFDDLSSRRPHLRVRSTPHGRSGPLLRAPLAGTPARAHQRLPGLSGAPRRSATQAGRLLPRGATGNAHRALPGQLVALRRVHGGLKDGSWSARRPQRAPLAAAGAGRDWAGSSTTTRGRRAGGFSRTRWLDPRLGRETVDQPGHVEIMGAVGHEPRPRAPAASRPSHERPGGRVPRPCRLATWQEGRVARIVDDTGLIAIGVDRSVWLGARGEDGPGQRVGPVQRAGVHVPVRRPVEPFRPVLPVANAGFGQRAARPPAARAGVGAVAVVALVVHGPAGPHGGVGAPAEFALRSCALGRHSWLPTHRRPVAAAHFPSLCGPSERMWTDAAGPRPPPRRNPAHDPARNRRDRHPR